MKQDSLDFLARVATIPRPPARPAIARMVSTCLREARRIDEGPKPTTWPAARRFDPATMTTLPAIDFPPEQLVGSYVRLIQHVITSGSKMIAAGTCLPVASVDPAGKLTLRLQEWHDKPGSAGYLLSCVPPWVCELVFNMEGHGDGGQ